MKIFGNSVNPIPGLMILTSISFPRSLNTGSNSAPLDGSTTILSDES